MSSQERQFLIIDTDSKVRAEIRTYLGEMGYRNILEATRVKEALDIINTAFIDCIIAEWDTPGASAYTLLKLIRAQKRFNHIFSFSWPMARRLRSLKRRFFNLETFMSMVSCSNHLSQKLSKPY